MPGPLRAGSGRAGPERAASRRARSSLAPATIADIVAARGGRGGRRTTVSNRSDDPCRSPATRRSACSRGSARSIPRAWTPTAPREATPRSPGRSRLGPAGVIREVLASKLMGRGGAAFPTGRKWDAVAKAPARPHYVVCNADESEPGTFKDRILMEGDPFAVLEGMTIAGFATGSERGYLYVRGEYPLATRRMAAAIDAARAAGWLGTNIMEPASRSTSSSAAAPAPTSAARRRRCSTRSRASAASRATSRRSPSKSGLFGKPTVINNVETLVNIPPIVSQGGEAYAGIGTSGSTGPKLFCVSGHVARPGVYEVDFGITLGELIAMAGGVPGGKAIRAVLLGGAAGVFVGPDQLDIPLTFEGTRAAAATLGSGVVLVFDDSVDLGDILVRIAAFFRDESCGQCVPCRVGTVRQEELLHRLRSARPIGGRADELALLREIGQVMRDASICGLGQTASNAIESAFATLDPFPERGGFPS